MLTCQTGSYLRCKSVPLASFGLDCHCNLRRRKTRTCNFPALNHLAAEGASDVEQALGRVLGSLDLTAHDGLWHGPMLLSQACLRSHAIGTECCMLQRGRAMWSRLWGACWVRCACSLPGKARVKKPQRAPCWPPGSPRYALCSRRSKQMHLVLGLAVRAHVQGRQGRGGGRERQAGLLDLPDVCPANACPASARFQARTSI